MKISIKAVTWGCTKAPGMNTNTPK